MTVLYVVTRANAEYSGKVGIGGEAAMGFSRVVHLTFTEGNRRYFQNRCDDFKASILERMRATE
jgi:hypothetical protein